VRFAGRTTRSKKNASLSLDDHDAQSIGAWNDPDKIRVSGTAHAFGGIGQSQRHDLAVLSPQPE